MALPEVRAVALEAQSAAKNAAEILGRLSAALGTNSHLMGAWLQERDALYARQRQLEQQLELGQHQAASERDQLTHQQACIGQLEGQLRELRAALEAARAEHWAAQAALDTERNDNRERLQQQWQQLEGQRTEQLEGQQLQRHQHQQLQRQGHQHYPQQQQRQQPGCGVGTPRRGPPATHGPDTPRSDSDVSLPPSQPRTGTTTTTTTHFVDRVPETLFMGLWPEVDLFAAAEAEAEAEEAGGQAGPGGRPQGTAACAAQKSLGAVAAAGSGRHGKATSPERGAGAGAAEKNNIEAAAADAANAAAAAQQAAAVEAAAAAAANAAAAAWVSREQELTQDHAAQLQAVWAENKALQADLQRALSYRRTAQQLRAENQALQQQVEELQQHLREAREAAVAAAATATAANGAGGAAAGGGFGDELSAREREEVKPQPLSERDKYLDKYREARQACREAKQLARHWQSAYWGLMATQGAAEAVGRAAAAAAGGEQQPPPPAEAAVVLLGEAVEAGADLRPQGEEGAGQLSEAVSRRQSSGGLRRLRNPRVAQGEGGGTSGRPFPAVRQPPRSARDGGGASEAAASAMDEAAAAMAEAAISRGNGDGDEDVDLTQEPSDGDGDGDGVARKQQQHGDGDGDGREAGNDVAAEGAEDTWPELRRQRRRQQQAEPQPLTRKCQLQQQHNERRQEGEEAPGPYSGWDAAHGQDLYDLQKQGHQQPLHVQDLAGCRAGAKDVTTDSEAAPSARGRGRTAATAANGARNAGRSADGSGGVGGGWLNKRRSRAWDPPSGEDGMVENGGGGNRDGWSAAGGRGGGQGPAAGMSRAGRGGGAKVSGRRYVQQQLLFGRQKPKQQSQQPQAQQQDSQQQQAAEQPRRPRLQPSQSWHWAPDNAQHNSARPLPGAMAVAAADDSNCGEGGDGGSDGAAGYDSAGGVPLGPPPQKRKAQEGPAGGGRGGPSRNALEAAVLAAPTGPTGDTAGRPPWPPAVAPVSSPGRPATDADAAELAAVTAGGAGGNMAGRGGGGARDGEPGYKYMSVVRVRAEREALSTIECAGCRAFYEAITSWGHDMIPTCTHTRERAGATAAASAAAVAGRCMPPAAGAASGAPQPGPGPGVALASALRQAGGRHRFKYAPPATPEGFWDIGFGDDTQLGPLTVSANRTRNQC